jgi:hypothetical protein
MSIFQELAPITLSLFWKVPYNTTPCSGVRAFKRLRKPPSYICRRWVLGASGHTFPLHSTEPHTCLSSIPQKQTESQKQRVRCQLEKLGRFLEQQEQLFMAWLEELGQTIGQARETYGIQVSRDIARLDKLIGELEAKQGQSEWELMQVSVSGPGLPSSLCLVG